MIEHTGELISIIYEELGKARIHNGKQHSETFMISSCDAIRTGIEKYNKKHDPNCPGDKTRRIFCGQTKLSEAKDD